MVDEPAIGINLITPKKAGFNAFEKGVFIASLLFGVVSIIFVIYALAPKRNQSEQFTAAVIETTPSAFIISITPTPSLELIKGYILYADDFVSFQYPSAAQVAVKKGKQVNNCDKSHPYMYDVEEVTSVIINTDSGFKFNITLQLVCRETKHAYLNYTTSDPRYFIVNKEKAKRLLTSVPLLAHIPTLNQYLFVYSEEDKLQHATLIHETNTNQFSGSYENYSEIDFAEAGLNNFFGVPFNDKNGKSLNAYYVTLECPAMVQADADACAAIIDNFFKTVKKTN